MMRLIGLVGFRSILGTLLVVLPCIGGTAENLTNAESVALQDAVPNEAPLEVETYPVLAAFDPPPGWIPPPPSGVPSSGGFPIDLLAAISLAGADDLEIKFMRGRLQEAYADHQLSAVRYLPSLSLFTEFFKHEGRIQGTVGDLPRASKQSLYTGAKIEWVYDLTHERYEKLAACQDREAVAADLAATREDRLYHAAILYFDLVGAVAQTAVAEESYHRGLALVEYQESLHNRGKGLKADVARAQAFRAEQAQGLTQAHGTREISSVRLATQLRLDPMVPLDPAEDAVVPVVLVDTAQPREALIAGALKKRPELRREQLDQMAAQTRRNGARMKRFLPTFSTEARVGGFGGDDGSGMDEYDDRADLRAYVEWGTDHLGKGDRARIAQRDAQLSQAAIRKQQIEDQIRKEVLVSLAGVQTAEGKMKYATEQVLAASESLSLTDSRLRSGLAIPYEVITAQDALVRAKNNQVGSIIEFNKAELSLLRSLGGFESILKR